MQIKNLDELEKQLSQVTWNLDEIESLSKILHGFFEGTDLKSKDAANLSEILNERITLLKNKFSSIIEELGI